MNFKDTEKRFKELTRKGKIFKGEVPVIICMESHSIVFGIEKRLRELGIEDVELWKHFDRLTELKTEAQEYYKGEIKL